MGCLVASSLMSDLLDKGKLILGIIIGYSSCSAFLQCDWLIIGQESAILPDGFSCQTKLKTHA